MTTAARPWLNATAAGPATSWLSASITEGRRTEAATWPCLMSDTAPVWPTQNWVLPGPPIDGPVTQFEVPAAPPAPACATHRPSRASVRCRGALSPPRTTLTVTLPVAAWAATAGMAAPASTAPAKAAAARRCILILPATDRTATAARKPDGRGASGHSRLPPGRTAADDSCQSDTETNNSHPAIHVPSRHVTEVILTALKSVS